MLRTKEKIVNESGTCRARFEVKNRDRWKLRAVVNNGIIKSNDVTVADVETGERCAR